MHFLFFPFETQNNNIQNHVNKNKSKTKSQYIKHLLKKRADIFAMTKMQGQIIPRLKNTTDLLLSKKL